MFGERMTSYLRQAGKCCDGRVWFVNDHGDDGGDGGGGGILWGVGNVCEERRSAPRVGGLR